VPKYVVADQEATVTADVSGLDGGGTVTFEFRRAADGAFLDSVEGRLEGSAARCAWTAKGPAPDAPARSWRVRCTVRVPVPDGRVLERLVPDELEVYHDRLEVRSLAAKDGAVLKKAPFELTVGRGAHRKTLRRDTGAEGRVELTKLPPGVPKIEWLRWAVLKEWTAETATAREAKLDVAKEARLVWPKASPHAQLVDLEADPEDPARGSRLRVRARLKDGLAGDLVYLKLEPGRDGSRRSEPRPGVVDGVEEAWCPDGGAKRELKEDAGEVEVEVELGKAGGDVFTVKVGGSEKCADAKVTVETRRRLHVRVARRAGAPALDLARSRAALDEAAIELAEAEPVTLAEEPGDPEGSWIDGAPLGLSGRLLHLTDRTEGHFHERADRELERPGVRLLVCDLMTRAGDHTQIFSGVVVAPGETVPWRDGRAVPGKRLEVTDSGYELFPVSLRDGRSSPLEAGRWKLDDGSVAGELADDDVWIDPVGHPRALFVRLPEAARSALERDPERRVKLAVVVERARGPFLGSARGARLAVTARAAPAARPTAPGALGDAITHEIGHACGQAVTAETCPPGLDPGAHGRVYTGNLHFGPHCADGMAEADYAGGEGAAGTAYAGDFGEKWECTCVMFGQVDPERARSTGRFCARCLPFLKASDVAELRGEGA